MDLSGFSSSPLFRRFFLTAPLAAIPVAAQRGRRGMAPGFDNESFPTPKDETERRIVGVLQDMAANHGTWASVPTSDGKWLRILTEACLAKNVVEVGTSTGYSGLFFSLALAKTGGHLTTHEIDQGRADIARANFAKAGVERLVTLVFGNAHETTKNVSGPVDVVFIDADKEAYVQYLDVLLPKVRPGGLILAHNTDMVPDYLAGIRDSAALDTVIYTGGGGLSVTLKKI